MYFCIIYSLIWPTLQRICRQDLLPSGPNKTETAKGIKPMCKVSKVARTIGPKRDLWQSYPLFLPEPIGGHRAAQILYIVKPYFTYFTYWCISLLYCIFIFVQHRQQLLMNWSVVNDLLAVFTLLRSRIFTYLQCTNLVINVQFMVHASSNSSLLGCRGFCTCSLFLFLFFFIFVFTGSFNLSLQFIRIVNQ